MNTVSLFNDPNVRDIHFLELLSKSIVPGSDSATVDFNLGRPDYVEPMENGTYTIYFGDWYLTLDDLIVEMLYAAYTEGKGFSQEEWKEWAEGKESYVDHIKGMPLVFKEDENGTD